MILYKIIFFAENKDIWAKEIKKRRIMARGTILPFGRPIKKEMQERENKKGPRPHAPKSIHPSFFSQIEN